MQLINFRNEALYITGIGQYPFVISLFKFEHVKVICEVKEIPKP